MNIPDIINYMNLNYFLIRLIIILLSLTLDYIVSQDFPFTILEENSTVLNFKNKKDNNFIATTKKIYSGLDPVNIISLKEELPPNVVFTKYENSSYLVAACTKYYMLSHFLPGAQNETRIYSYSSSSINPTNDTCSLSFMSSYAYIVHTKIEGKSIVLTLVKQKLHIYSSHLGIWSSPATIHDTLSLNTLEDFPYISCETILVINNENDTVHVCSFIDVDSRKNNTYSYMATTGNYTYSYHLNERIELFNSESLLYFKLVRINSTFMRYILGNNSYEIYLTKENEKYVFNIVPEGLRNKYLYSFITYKDLYYYNNEFIFHAVPTHENGFDYYLYISNNKSNNNLITIVYNKPINKISGFYSKENDSLIYIYQYANKIEYFIFEQKCLYNAWHIEMNNTLSCYDNQNYCKTNKYYYHTNTRECVLSKCRKGYYKFNFECYYGSCPENTSLISPNNYECESLLEYCYIDVNYKTHCSNKSFDGYQFKYENTKIYFRTCNDSLYFFGFSTFLYQNICFKNCPSQTITNHLTGKCECNFFIYYSNSESDNYQCLLENETCDELGKYSIPNQKECVDTKQECIDRGYKIFNKLCLITCPINTIQNGDNCECEFNFYKNGETLYCFEEGKSCENIGYPVKSNTNECFLSKDDCINKGYKYFDNNICFIGINPDNNTSNKTDQMNKTELIKEIKDYLINNFKNINIELTGDFEIKEEQLLIALTTTLNQKNNNNKNKTTIDFGQCETKLKNAYNISHNDSLYILKIDLKKEGMNIPKIEYELYYNLNENLTLLDLTICEGEKVEISIPVSINEDIEKYNSSSDYYNNICSPTSSDESIDIPISERRNVFLNNNMSLCEENCELIDYDYTIKNAKCRCKIKTQITAVDEIKFDKNKLLENFIKIDNIMNLNLLKCYKTAFNRINIKKNIGFFIIDTIIIIYFITLIIFITCSYNEIKKELTDIISALENDNNNKNKDKRIRVNKPNKNKRSSAILNLNHNNKKNKNKNVINAHESAKIDLNYNTKLEEEGNSNSKNNVKNNNINEEKLNLLNYKEFELNSMEYKKASIHDKRTYLQYYISLLRYNHLLIFSFYNNKDYNSRIIKIFLFFFFFSAYFAVNALFFTDSTMNKIYEDKGIFNFYYHFPQIIYSSLISGIVGVIIKQLSLSQKMIVDLRQEKNVEDLSIKEQKILKNYKIKIITFFIISFILLIFFGYYLTCFCAVYINTQIILIKDTIISFAMSFIYPFLKYLIPGIFRIPALNSKKEDGQYLYKISLILQMI